MRSLLVTLDSPTLDSRSVLPRSVLPRTDPRSGAVARRSCDGTEARLMRDVGPQDPTSLGRFDPATRRAVGRSRSVRAPASTRQPDDMGLAGSVDHERDPAVNADGRRSRNGDSFASFAFDRAAGHGEPEGFVSGQLSVVRGGCLSLVFFDGQRATDH